MDHADICPLDNQPCFVFLDVDEAHWRCGTTQCMITEAECRVLKAFEGSGHIDAATWRSYVKQSTIELDACGYYQGPLGVETDRPQIFDRLIVRLLVLTIGSLGIWAAIWKSAAIVSSLIPPA